MMLHITLEIFHITQGILDLISFATLRVKISPRLDKNFLCLAPIKRIRSEYLMVKVIGI